MFIEADGDYCENFRYLFNIRRGKRQDGINYPGLPKPITYSDLFAHLCGHETFAFECSSPSHGRQPAKALFCGFDIDRLFSERLAIFRSVLYHFGLSDAAVVTGGSSPERGKIIITLSEPLKFDLVHHLLRLLLEEAHRSAPELVPLCPLSGDCEVYPKSSNGNTVPLLLRIGGRNKGKGGELEPLSSIDGKALDFSAVRPLTERRLLNLVRSRAISAYDATHSPRIREMLTSPWSRVIGTQEIVKRLTSLAHYCYETRGAAGLWEYKSMLRQILSNSPDLNQPSNSGDKRNPVLRELDSTSLWSNALKKPRWTPKAEEHTGYPAGYNALQKHALKNELPKHCVSVDFGTLSMLTGNSKSNTRAGIRRACEAGALILLHPGLPYRAGMDGGLPAMYGIVGNTETVADVWDRAIREDALKRRYAEIPILGCADLSAFPFIPTPLFWDTLSDFSRHENIIPFEKRPEATGVAVTSGCDSGVAA